METTILMLLQLVQVLLPNIGSDSSVVTKILAALTQIIPLLASLGQTAKQAVENILSALKTNGNLTADQLAVVDAMSAEVDAAWDTDVAAYLSSKKKIVVAPATSQGRADPPASTASSEGQASQQPAAQGT